jgi:hypothetical protein
MRAGLNFVSSSQYASPPCLTDVEVGGVPQTVPSSPSSGHVQILRGLADRSPTYRLCPIARRQRSPSAPLVWCVNWAFDGIRVGA